LEGGYLGRSFQTGLNSFYTSLACSRIQTYKHLTRKPPRA
jgi:hypothetical protein